MLATIEKISEVKTHPNADALDIVRVLGYECIVRRGAQVPGEKVVFIQPDTILPADRDWATSFFTYTSKGRVKAARLRGEWSMGIILAQREVEEELAAQGIDWNSLSQGDDIGEVLGIRKYEPPLPSNLMAKGELPFGIPKTDEERWQNLENLPFGATVDVTLKIDGSSFTAYCALPGHVAVTEPVTGICSRSQELKIGEDFTNPWLEAERLTGVMAKLEEYCVANGVSLALRGEVYGTGVQAAAINPHSKLPRGVKFFSVWNIAEHHYAGPGNQHDYTRVCEAFGLPAVDVIEEGVPLTEEMIRRYGDELDALNGQPFEGVVIKGQGFSFKVMNKYYDSKK